MHPTESFAQGTNSRNLDADGTIRRMVECDLFYNLGKGREYTGFKGMYKFFMLKKGLISKYGMVYDVTDHDFDEHHLLTYLKGLKKEKPSEFVMTSGSFLSMNEPLQNGVVEAIKELSKIEPVRLYISKDVSGDVDNLFVDTKEVRIKYYDKKKHNIPHFVKSRYSFNFVMPHTEDIDIRVDLESRVFGWPNKYLINKYFDKLVAKLDREIELDNRAEN